MLLDAADLAPAGELSRAALAFAEAPGIKVPSLEVFRDPSGVWWHTGTPEHARTVRPSDQPKCATHGLFEPCRSCAADAKAATDQAKARVAQLQSDAAQHIKAVASEAAGQIVARLIGVEVSEQDRASAVNQVSAR